MNTTNSKYTSNILSRYCLLQNVVDDFHYTL